MQDVGFAIEETTRAVRELGMVGPYIGSDFGRALDDPALDPFYETLVALDRVTKSQPLLENDFQP